jgi:hypothetical protein
MDGRKNVNLSSIGRLFQGSGVIMMIFIIIGLFIPQTVTAQTACRTDADCPCGQGCALEEGICRYLVTPFCRTGADCDVNRFPYLDGICDSSTGVCELTCECDTRCPNSPCACDAVARLIEATPPGGTVKIKGVVSTNARVAGQILKGEGPTRTVVQPRNPNLPVFTVTNGSLIAMTISGGTSGAPAGIRGDSRDSTSGVTGINNVKIEGTAHGVDGSFASLTTKATEVSNTGIAAQVHMFGSALLKGILIHDNDFGIEIFDDTTGGNQTNYDITGFFGTGCDGVCMYNNHFGNIYVKGNLLNTFVHIKDCLISNAGGVGILLQTTLGEIKDVCIDSTQPNPDGFFGDGVSLLDAVATLTNSVISDSARAAVSVFCPSGFGLINIGNTTLIDNAIKLDDECSFDNAFNDLGGNVCIQNGNTVACSTLSSNLEPPEPL